jgi:ketosteroid isomerase-like protein
MSEENVEVVRLVVEAFNARDRQRLLSMMDPAFEFHSAAEQKTYRGIEAMLQYRQDADAVMEGLHTEDDRFLDAGGECVVHLYRVLGRGAGSGAPVSRDNAMVWRLRTAGSSGAQVFLDQREALEAAGLSE